MAAGLGYKEFATGDILTAADANGYLASQVVMVFASASARTSAITSPQEGMISYLKDTNSTEYYSGSAWVAIGGSSGGSTFSGCLLYNSANISLSNGTTTLLTWDNEVIDTDAYHSTSSNTSRITVPTGKAGKYLVIGKVYYSQNSSGRRIVAIRKNSSSLTEFETTPGSTEPTILATYIVDLAVGDHVEMTAWQNSGVTLTAQNGGQLYSTFSAYLIGA